MSGSEFSHFIDPRQVTERPVHLAASEAERKALARRFALVSIGRLEASVTLVANGEAVDVRGRLSADVVQSCAISGDDLAVSIDEPLVLRFVPEKPIAVEELELDAGELDEIPYSGAMFDLGEAVAQGLALAIDPYAEGPNADKVRKDVGLADGESGGPFAALKALKKDL
ncbi:MAG: DUF177 domain-containing protein [Croceibacterium sp.]